ncbi:anti-sigma-V factor RsiV [Paenibacillus montaniterrae]|uniref:Anti-sigma-V factor RsiV n=1 Tax=Paenibacillus montaniterrae TaxID=429341 RepID=A0A920CZI8_9BACL|nr:anti-sigma-V factor rsiV [Paenibacillus montaniterrae]GIP18515.1 anti-sigma-V factor RsiV [Paenibacillus montaniterrae]
MDKKLEELKKEYHHIPVPDELDFVVRQALKQNKGRSVVRRSAIGAAAAVLLFVGSVNASPALARAMEQIPVLGQVVNVVTFTSYKLEEGGYSANIEVPSLENMNNKELQASLNSKYIEESKALYEQFVAETRLQDVEGGHFSLESGYEIKTNNEQILSLARYVVETAGSAAESYQFDTIDKQNEWLITLPSLFKNDDYIAIISDNIKQQMISQMEQDDSLVYWVEQKGEEVMSDAFQQIAADQSFYINVQQQLVIVFNEYEVAPGYMGIVEFTIPSQVLADVLVSDVYIK